MSTQNQLVKDLINILSKRSDDYLFGYLDALLPFRDSFKSKTLAIMVEIVESILFERGSL